jgi:hypothetical protein
LEDLALTKILSTNTFKACASNIILLLRWLFFVISLKSKVRQHDLKTLHSTETGETPNGQNEAFFQAFHSVAVNGADDSRSDGGVGHNSRIPVHQ